MRFLSFVLVSLGTTGALAGNNFVGLAVANSASAASYTCRTQAQWNDVAKNAKSAGFSSLRIEGFDCDALSKAASAAAAQGLTVLAGIWVGGTMASSAESIRNDVETFKTAVKAYGSGRFKALTVGNEVNDSGRNIINKVNEVRNSLRAAGINIPVSTVHEWIIIRSDPTFCNGDFVGANAHAFYDGNVASSQAGDFLTKTVIPSLKATCGPAKPIWITETGWPSRGNSNRKAVASVSDQRAALSSLNCAARDDRTVLMYSFEPDDQTWKGNEDERSFGIFGKHNLGEVFAKC